MPIREIAGTNLKYYLLVFDEQGQERNETDNSLMSQAVMQRLAEPSSPVTDVFVISHGWMGDVPAAIAQYDK
jgi:hypothetical protein